MTEDDVLQILNLIEKSNFDFLQLEVGDLKLVVSKGGHLGDAPISAIPATQVRVEAKEAEAVESKPKAREVVVKEGTLPIVAPMVGTFYTTPEPGAPPFTDVGRFVEEDTTVGLIEVMKVFTAVKSGVRGLTTEICIQNGQFVEYGQTLFLVTPEVDLD